MIQPPENVRAGRAKSPGLKPRPVSTIRALVSTP